MPDIKQFFARAMELWDALDAAQEDIREFKMEIGTKGVIVPAFCRALKLHRKPPKPEVEAAVEQYTMEFSAPAKTAKARADEGLDIPANLRRPAA